MVTRAWIKLIAAVVIGLLLVSAASAQQFTIEVDARGLSIGEVSIGTLGRHPTEVVNSVSLSAGTFQLSYQIGPNFPQVNFSVLADGTLDFDPALDGVLSGRGTSTLTVRGIDVQVDATALTSQRASLLAPFATRNVQAVTLLPGVHLLSYQIGPNFPQVNFSVLADGTLDFDPALDGVLSGRGTSALTVRGIDVQIDATALTSQRASLLAPFATRNVQAVTLLPGVHLLSYQIGPNFPQVNFSALADGTLDFDPELDEVLNGRGTSALTIRGIDVQIDATALTSQRASLLAPFATRNVQALTLLPGRHRLSYQIGPNFPQVNFSVLADGTLDFDPTLDGVLSGRGTSTLTVRGTDVQIDATALTSQRASLLAPFATRNVQALTLLPGRHRLSYQIGPNFPQVNFSVLADGTLDFDPTLDGVLSGRGTSTLTVRGIDVQIDATALTSRTLFFLKPFATRNVQLTILLPGVHVLSYQSSANFPQVNFSVLTDGTIDFDASLNGVLSGRGTSTLVLGGLEIGIDATDFDTAIYGIAGFGRFSPETVRTFRFLPGLHRFSGPDLLFVFEVVSDGTVDFDSSLDASVSGRGTSTLIVTGTTVPAPPGMFSITLDARSLSAPLLTLGGNVSLSFSTDTIQVFDLDPGEYSLSYTAVGNANIQFTVAADGTVDFDSALDGILTGRGTNQMTITGAGIEIDVSALSAPFLFLNLNDSVVLAGNTNLRLLPGTHAPFYTAVGSPNVQFTVAADGTVDFEPSLDGIMSGRGTNRITLTGASIDIDVAALSAPFLFLSLNQEATALVGDTNLRLLPGAHAPFYVAFRNAFVEFTVGADSTVDFDPSLDGILSGRGSNRLTIVGAPVTIDVSVLSAPFLFMNVNDTAVLADETTLRLLPGLHVPFYVAFRNAFVEFTVGTDGTVDFDSSLDGIMSGRGTNRLTIVGAPITIDVSVLSAPFLFMNINDTAVLVDETTLRLLPGLHVPFYVAVSNSFTEFTVAADGMVDFDPSFDSIQSGRGTNRLTIAGASVEIDVSALSAPFLFMNVNESAVLVGSTTLHLLPGAHAPFYVAVGTPNVQFTVAADGTIDFGPGLDLVLQGRGTSSLLVNGASVQIDAAGLEALSFTVSQAGVLASAVLQNLVLLPGSHAFNSADLDFVFLVTPDVTFEYDASLDNVLTGRGTDLLVVLGDQVEPPTPQEIIRQIIDLIAALDPDAFKGANENRATALINKLEAVLELIQAADTTPDPDERAALLQEAIDKLRNDVLKKTDGCMATGAPDNNDWIVDCDVQAELQVLLEALIEGLEQELQQ